MDNNAIDVERFIDAQPIRAFHIMIIVLIFLAMLSDGYDMQAVGFAAPGIVRMLRIDRSLLGPVLSASLAGMLFGAPLFGWLGDRFGRRVAILSGAFIYGMSCLVTAAAQNQPELLLLRFVTGLGLGGVASNAIALVAEYAPKRVRATMIVSAQLGLTFGSMLPAVASGVLEGSYGWRSLFLAGGIATLAIFLLMCALLPESLKYLVAKGAPQSRIRKIACGLDPSLRGRTDVTFMVPQGSISGAQKWHMKALFADGLTWITPLIWVIYVTFLTANYFMHGWMPILFRGEGLSIGQTAVAAAMFDVGGVLGALVASRLLDRFGVRAIIGLYVLSCPAIGVIGVLGHSVILLSAAIFISGFCLIGITLSMGAVASLVYPTEIRAKGIGWAYGVGRLFSMLSPVVGGWLVGMQLPVRELFLAPVVPMAIGALACFVFMRLCFQRYSGYSLQTKVARVSPSLS